MLEDGVGGMSRGTDGGGMLVAGHGVAVEGGVSGADPPGSGALGTICASAWAAAAARLANIWRMPDDSGSWQIGHAPPTDRRNSEPHDGHRIGASLTLSRSLPSDGLRRRTPNGEFAKRISQAMATAAYSLA